MSVASLVAGIVISQILFIATKVLFIGYLDMDLLILQIVFIFILMIETIAVVRRMGVINYLESFLLIVVWFLASMICDIVITATLIGRDMYSHIYYWLANLAILLAILLFHKALHVQVRKANANH